MGYSLDLLTGGTASADSVLNDDAGWNADKACDNNTTTTRWASKITLPHWWQYNLPASKKARKITILAYFDGTNLQVKDFLFQGYSADWGTIYTGQCANVSGLQSFTFNNNTAYTSYRFLITSNWAAATTISVWEFEMMSFTSREGFVFFM